ncbi:Ubiquitin-conjugating enzyme E2 E2 [Termitomyces sp. J132]|nr:Ubiquitin-conjugating enzyme E2 E2 [Termitomyces sp. J132]
MTLKRIHREVADLRKEDLGPIVLAPLEDNLYLWKGSIPGPEGSVYENGVFDFEVVLAPDYPFSAPKVVFKTRIYHMNISEQGNICIDILKHNWSPALSLFKVMLSLSSLLTDPNPKDPLVPSIANQYIRNRKAHDAMARQWTEMYARPKQPPAPTAGSTLSAKAKGKQKASDAPSGSSISSSASINSELITIEDSDDERQDLPKRGSTKGSKRKREEKLEVNLVNDDDEVKVSDGATASKKRAVGIGRTPRNSVVNGASDRSQPLTQLGEVIVLDDD